MAEKKMTLSELIENGKTKGKLTTKEITDFIEEMDFEVEQVDKLYDILESNNIEIIEDFSVAADLDFDHWKNYEGGEALYLYLSTLSKTLSGTLPVE